MLFKNEVFEWQGVKMRLLSADAVSDEAWCIEVNNELAWPECLSFREIAELEASGPGLPLISPTISRARLDKCAEAWERLRPLLDSAGMGLFHASERNRAIQLYAEKVGCSERTLHKDLRRYWQRGQTEHALLPDYHHSGRFDFLAKDSDAKATRTAGRGRKPEEGGKVYQMSDDDAKFMRKVIDEEYIRDANVTIADAHTSLIRQHYRYEDGNGEKFVLPPGECPSLRQFHYFLLRNYSLEARLRGRLGDKDFEKDHREVVGTIMADCQGVGHYYEIDATIADVYLVSEDDVNTIIGKPTLYFITDRKSRLIVGFYVGLENASWNAALQAILSIAEDKQALCERYGVVYDPEDWPAHQVFPSQFLADRGEMVSGASDNIAEGMQGTVANVPGKRPDWKAIAESGFHLAHCVLRPITPAYDPPSNATRRRGKHYEKDACLSPRQFGNLILNYIINSNRKEMLYYDMSTEELIAGVRPSPIELWHHGIATRAGLLNRFPEEMVRFALLRKDTAVVTEKGVEFKGAFYTFPEGFEQNWFLRARKRRFKVVVSYDMRLVDNIYIHSLDGKSAPYVASLSERSKKYAGKCFEEMAFFEDLRRKLRLGAAHTRLQSRVDMIDATAPTIATAEDRLKTQGKKMSRSARRKDVKPARTQERSKERQAMAPLTLPHPSDASAETPMPETTAEVIPLPTASPAPQPEPDSLEARAAAARAAMLE